MFAVRCPQCDRRLPAQPPEGSGTRAATCPGCGRGYRWEGRVLVLDDEPGHDDYPPGLYALDAELEPRSWWYASRNAVIARALRPWLARGWRTLVDVGCGTGFVLAHLERQGFVVAGLDMAAEGLAVAATRTAAPLVRSGRTVVPFAEPVIDVVTLCDVLEHAEEAPLLGACREALRDEGLLLVTVPARPTLWSLEDVLVGHRRRYTAGTLRATLEASGLAVRLLRPFHALVTPLAWWGLRRAGPPPEPAADPAPDPATTLAAMRTPPSPRQKALFGCALAVENRLGSWFPLPFGSHLLAIAQRV